MAYKICPSCKGEIEFGYVFCVQCGARLDEETAESTADADATAIVDLDAEGAFFGDAKKAAAPARAESATVVRASTPDLSDVALAKSEPVPSAPAPVAAPAPAPVAAPAPAWEIKVQVLRTSTGEKGSHTFKADQVIVGRTDGDLTFPNDPTLSSPHARIFVSDGVLMAEDLASRNGLYHRVVQPIELVHGLRFLVGEQVMRFEYFNPVRILKQPDGTYFCGSAAPQWKFRLVQILKGGVEGNVYCSSAKVVTIGREDSDINFADDRFISYQHAIVEAKDGRYYLADRNSRNGTYIQIDHAQELAKGDIVAIGKALLRVDLEAA